MHNDGLDEDFWFAHLPTAPNCRSQGPETTHHRFRTNPLAPRIYEEAGGLLWVGVCISGRRFELRLIDASTIAPSGNCAT